MNKSSSLPSRVLPQENRIQGSHNVGVEVFGDIARGKGVLRWERRTERRRLAETAGLTLGLEEAEDVILTDWRGLVSLVLWTV